VELDIEALDRARYWIRAANSIAVLTGAGISAESGVPTFRDAGGLWRNFRFEDLATPEAFKRDPKLVWDWYNFRRERIAEAQPNAGHKALVELEARKSEFTLITQNVDGLHDLAGSKNVLKLHGDIWQLCCTKCGTPWIDRRPSLPDLPPHCLCGGLARPGVVWFGEPLPRTVLTEAVQAVKSLEILLVIGTSAIVYPAADLIPLAKAHGRTVIEINPDETPCSCEADCSLHGPSGEILPYLVGTCASCGKGKEI
jgi:NAD-dependent deacetylase